MYTRLTRETPWKLQIGAGTVVALMVAMPGVFTGYMIWFHDQGGDRTRSFVFAGVWLFLGILILIGSIQQAFAGRSQETIVEVEPAEFWPGQTVRVRVTQPGPLRLQSIYVNLAGQEMTRSRTTKYLDPYRITEIDGRRIAPGESVEEEASFHVPDVAASNESPDSTLRWKIEVWGRVAFWPDFVHPFPVKVKHTSS